MSTEDGEVPFKKVVEGGFIPGLISALKEDKHPLIQFEAAWVLTNVAGGASEHTQAIVKAGAVPIFIRLLRFSFLR